MEATGSNQLAYRGTAPERAAQGHIGTAQERRLSGLLEVEERAHLRMEALVLEGVGGKLILQEVADDLLGVGDRIQHLLSRPSRIRWKRVTEEVSRNWIAEQVRRSLLLRNAVCRWGGIRNGLWRAR